MLFAVDEKTAAMESQPAVSRPVEPTECGAAGDVQAAGAQNPKSSSGSYAVIIKYDNAYMKSNDGILRLLHVVGFFYL